MKNRRDKFLIVLGALYGGAGTVVGAMMMCAPAQWHIHVLAAITFILGLIIIGVVLYIART